jgi:hypothetical protein
MADESIAAPQRARTPDPCGLFPANHPFQRTAGRGHHRLLGSEPAAAVLVGEGHAPVVAVLVPDVKKKMEADESIAAPKGHGPPDPAAFPPANRPFSRDRRKGP